MMFIVNELMPVWFLSSTHVMPPDRRKRNRIGRFPCAHDDCDEVFINRTRLDNHRRKAHQARCKISKCKVLDTVKGVHEDKDIMMYRNPITLVFLCLGKGWYGWIIVASYVCKN